MTDQLTLAAQRPVATVRRRWWLLFSVAYGFFGLAMGEDATYDLRNYHFFDPYWAFINHFHDIAAAGEQSYLNPLISTPFYFGPRYLPPILFQFLIGTIQGLSGPLLYMIARELRLKKALSVFVAFAGMVTATALSEIGDGQGDTLIAPLLFVAILLVLRVANRPSEATAWKVRTLILAGLATGAAAGLKETVVCIAIAIGVLTLTSARDLRSALFNGSVLSLGIVGGFIITYGWWAVVLTLKFHDPLFPMYNEYIKSPWAQPSKNVGWDRSVHGLSALISYPYRIARNGLITGVVPFRQLSFPLLESLFAVGVVIRLRNVLTRRRWREEGAHLGALSAFFITAYLLWCWSTGIYRYVVAMEMLTPLLLVLMVKYIFDNFKFEHLGIPVAVVLIVAVFATQNVPNWGRTSYTSHYFSVAVPKDLNHSDATVVFVGDSPTSFIIPYFSHSPSFIRTGRDFPIVGKLAAQAERVLQHSRHVYVMWGHSSQEDMLTWSQLTTAATIATPSGPIVNQYPAWLAALNISHHANYCRNLAVKVNVSSVTLHYCQIR
jgi:hypothetical protein